MFDFTSGIVLTYYVDDIYNVSLDIYRAIETLKDEK